MITLRPTRSNDEQFLYQLYASTRVEELTLMGWAHAEATTFLQMQLRAQTQSYGLQFPDATHQIMEQGGVAIGRLITHRTRDSLLLIDIALLPQYRNAGIGTHTLVNLQAEAARNGQSMHLSVQPTNRAQRLYQRLGFVEVGKPGVYLQMRWAPEREPVALSML
jgi:ribosomal protein S18 acetylase RimI-like enzyme